MLAEIPMERSKCIFYLGTKYNMKSKSHTTFQCMFMQLNAEDCEVLPLGLTEFYSMFTPCSVRKFNIQNIPKIMDIVQAL